MLHCLFIKRKKCLWLSPFVSTVREAASHFEQLNLEESHHLQVSSYYGVEGRLPPRRQEEDQPGELLVASYEKGCSVLNSLMEGSRAGEIGLVVVDEVHLIGDGSVFLIIVILF